MVQVSAGGTHTLVLTSKNRMFVWGRAAFGRLGIAGMSQDLYAPVECFLPGVEWAVHPAIHVRAWCS